MDSAPGVLPDTLRGMTAPPGDRNRKHAVDFLCLAALVACQGWAAFSVVFVPAWLGTHPVALESVNGSVLSVAAAGAFVRAGQASLAAAWAAPLALWLPIDVVSWWAGRRFGPRAVLWLARSHPKSKSAVRRCERFFDRHRVGTVALAPWLPVPAAMLYAVSGWRRLPLPMFIAADAAGTVDRKYEPAA
jgi:membrane-associated protein